MMLTLSKPANSSGPCLRPRAGLYGLPQARGGFGLVLAGLLAGCMSETLALPPIEPQRIEFPLVPDSPIEREHRKLVAGFGGEYRNLAVQSILNQITERLRLVSDRPNEHFRVTILNSPLVNAFALPNGNVYLTRGLIALANDTAEIASVLAHEIAHVTARHASERSEFESTSVLISRVAAEVLDNPSARNRCR
jgi:Zn-dependent protease with chaperone function